VIARLRKVEIRFCLIRVDLTRKDWLSFVAPGMDRGGIPISIAALATLFCLEKRRQNRVLRAEPVQSSTSRPAQSHHTRCRATARLARTLLKSTQSECTKRTAVEFFTER
jgi:hypothetical protein